MKFFHVHPDDARWLRRWLRSNVVCFLAIVGFVLALRYDRLASMETTKPARTNSADVLLAPSPIRTDRRSQQYHADHQALPPETKLVLLQSRIPNPITPEGWRRTSRGWEHASTWAPVPRPLGEIIQGQQSREPVWMQLTLAKLRNVPPLVFALLQITAIAVIVNVARRRGDA